MRRTILNRRRVLTGLTATGLAAPAILRSTRAYAQSPTIKVGFVTPSTGPLAGFAEADDYVIAGLQNALSAVENNGKSYAIEIIKKDSQSNPNRAAEVAAELILDDEVDIITAAATPDTTNPVADQAELNEVPCITTDAPWQPYFFGRSGDPANPFQFTYHFFWGLEDVIANFLALWDDAGVTRKVAGLFPNDADGNAWGDPQLGLPTPLGAAGYAVTDPGRYQPLTDDFSSYISAFKDAGCEILTGVMIPPDFATFWSQAAQQDFRPKVATIGKALLFPSSVEALGDRGAGLTSEIWWSPHHPFASSLDGTTAKALADGFSTATGRPWTQPIGFKHALFEVVADVVRRAEDLDDPYAINDAVPATAIDTIVGRVDWSSGPVANVSKTPLVAGQWQKSGDRLSLEITTNAQAPEIPTTSELTLLN